MRGRLAGRVVLLPAAAAVALLSGSLLLGLDRHDAARQLWTIALWVLGLAVVGRTLVGMLRGRFAADLVATLAIVAAILLQQPFAGLIIVLMQTGGEGLEHYAERRASAAVRALEAEAPRIAHRLLGQGQIEDVPVGVIAVGDRLLVRPGEMIPCDGVVQGGRSQVDTSRLTGEALPVVAESGTMVSSGALNVDGSLELEVRAPAAASLYARIVELVRTAQASKAPMQRLADRFAVWFTPVTLVVCAVAWLASRDPLRVLAVLVVATPCPLILATPVAIIGGINRAARRQIIVRTGGALEALASANVVVFDKTGTLTVGRPEVSGVTALAPLSADELLGFVGAVEQSSGHLLARSLVDAAHARGLTLAQAHGIKESSGRGVSGEVAGRRIAVGGLSYIQELAPTAAASLRSLHDDGAALRAYVAIDGNAAGSVGFADQIRPNAAGVVARLRALGFGHVVLLSGDRAENVAAVAGETGIEEMGHDLLPEDKVRRIAQLAQGGRKVLMVGDGTNDAPALSSAAVGLALAAHGGGIAAEAADVVLLIDDLSRVPEAIEIGRRTLKIARQSIWVGLGLSAAAMVLAAAGYLVPAIGALLQEGIDVAVILNALRAVRGIERRPYQEHGLSRPANERFRYAA